MTLDLQLGQRLSDKYVINATYNKFVTDKGFDHNAPKSLNCDTMKVSSQAGKYLFVLCQESNQVTAEFNWLSSTKKNVH